MSPKVGFKHTAESIEKMRLAKKGKHMSPITEFKKGHPHGKRFEKGQEPWNKGLEGLRLSPETEFKKGQTPWNKNIEYTQIQWDKHPNFKGGKKSYVKMVKRLKLKPVCEACGKSEEDFGRRMHVHHIDTNRENNKLNNISILCVKCHNNLHKNWRFRKCHMETVA